MLRKFALPVLALLAVPAISSAAFEAGDFELTLTGSGTAPKSGTEAQIGATGSLGYFMTKEFEVGVRQEVTYLSTKRVAGSDVSATNWGGFTDGFVDYHFDLGAWQPFVGAFGGYQYPGGLGGSWAVGPEVGVKYFVNSTTFIFGSVGYSYALETPKTSTFQGNIGVGFRF
jgi:hypothetical protein